MSGKILWSSDNGDSWDYGLDDLAYGGPVDLIRCTDAGPLFALRDYSVVFPPPGDTMTGMSIFRSTDGRTWSGFKDPLLAAGITAHPGALAYDLITDTLYISYQDDDHIFGLLNATRVSAATVNAALDAAAPEDVLLKGVAPYWKRLSTGQAGRGTRTLAIQEKGQP